MDRSGHCTWFVSFRVLLGKKTENKKLTVHRVAAIEGFFLYRTDWEDAVAEAQARNATV